MTASSVVPATPPLYLLDTNILIHYARAKAVGHRLESDYSLLTIPYRPLICIVTHGEVFAFAAKRGWGLVKANALRNLLAQFVTVDINDPQVIEAYAQIDCQSQNIGRKMGKNDIWIAAIGHITAASLLTTDGDFDHLHGKYLTVLKIDSMTGQTI